MLSVAQEIRDQIAPYQNAINTALDFAMPLVGHRLDGLQDLSTLLQNSLASIQAQTGGVTTSGHFQIAIALPAISPPTLPFELGLDALLLTVNTTGGVTASLTPMLNVGFDFDGNHVSLDKSHTNLDLGFTLSLPNFQASASLHGFLYAHIADASLANQPGTSFSGHLKFGFDENNNVDPQFSGNAQIRLNADLSFVDPTMNASFNPTFHTQIQIDWGFDTASSKMQIPQIAFKNFSLDVDSFTHNFLGDIITTAQKYTKPLQPFIDMFDTPVPILSAFDSSQTVGDLLLQGAGLSTDQQDRFELIVRVIKTVNLIDLSGSTGGAVLNFGDINLTGATLDVNGDLLANFGFDTSQLSSVIDDIFNSPLLGDLKDTLQSVASYTGITSTAGFQFPVLEDPGPVIGGILTGQAKDMFTFTTGREHFELAPSIGVGIKDILGIFLSAGITFDASFAMGYDTAGLIKLVQDPLHKPEDLLHGFYFDNSVDSTAPPIPNVSAPKKTALYLQGFAELSASAVATLSGGLYANVNVELATANTSSHVYLDDLITSVSSPAKIFHLSGQVYAAATVEITLPNPVGPDITLFSYKLAKDVLVDFDPPPQPTETKPLLVIDVTNQHTLKLDPSKIGINGTAIVQAFHDYNTNGHLYDGIRVDYAGEIDLYVERRDDVTTTYYNLLGINGATPDGVSIAVIDPFRVFMDEGAANPAPAQTTSGVVLTGGKNVYYKYVDTSDGSHAKVLLAGGYGSSTLTGGTIEFGNFIPAARLDQAKQHFGNTSGFDAAGVALINSAIDADVAPANPAGIIGSTMTASRGGLMLGGPGANSFIATGAGAYEMIGGPWVDTFNITPSFGGVAATYAIDGGGGDSDSLVVRVPTGENVTFENSTVADKYNPAYKALAVEANAGLSATAHGIKKVQIVGTPGASVTLGDTSELNIDFAVRGGIELTFGGTNAPDIFSVVTTGPYHGQANHYSIPFPGIYVPIGEQPDLGSVPSENGYRGLGPYADPVYSVTRTFGTNGVTQTIPFAVSDATTSSIKLNAGGASDTYSINLGVGAFIDVAVVDTDVSTTNDLTVSTSDGSLVYNSLNFTDSTVELDYYTGSFIRGFQPIYSGLNQIATYVYYTTSVHYTPTVAFSGNVVPTIQSAIPFQHTTIDRPLALQATRLSIGGAYTSTLVPYVGLVDAANVGGVWDLIANPPTLITRNLTVNPVDVQILANTGSLSISSTTDYGISFNVLFNAGTMSLSKSGAYNLHADSINVLGNTGVVNVNYAPTATAITGQVNVGGALQSVANVHGTINLTGSYGLTIDDRGHSGTPPSWLITTTRTQVGDLTFNYVPYGYLYQAFWKAGSPVTYRDNIAFAFASYNLNNFTTYPYFPFFWSPQSTLIQNVDGESVTLNLSDYFGGQPPSGTITYGATNLPPGLSLNSATGLISGTIPFSSYPGSPFATLVSATNGQYTRQWTLEWDVFSAISIYPSFYSGVGAVNVDETSHVSFDPISVSDFLNRTPVVTVTGLPAGLTFDPNTLVISGTVPAGASTHGPYDVHIHADDGIETNDVLIPMIVSGIQLTSATEVRLNHNGEAVNFNLNATTTSGGTLTYSATGLPAGITLNAATGQITGTLAANANTQSPYYAEITYNDGYSTKVDYLTWTVLQTGVTDQISLLPISSQSNSVGDNAFVQAKAATSLSLPIQFFVQGLPPGLAFSYTPFYLNGYTSAYLYGTVPAAAALNSPYQVTVTATDGLNSASVTFQWQVTGPQPPTLPGDYNTDHTVNAADYVLWRKTSGTNVTPVYSGADGNGDGSIGAQDYTVWRSNFGQTGGSGTALAATETSKEIATSAPSAAKMAAPTTANNGHEAAGSLAKLGFGGELLWFASVADSPWVHAPKDASTTLGNANAQVIEKGLLALLASPRLRRLPATENDWFDRHSNEEIMLDDGPEPNSADEIFASLGSARSFDL